MTTWRRSIGYIDDATAGGKDFDALTTGAIPDPDTSLEVTTANVTGDPDTLDRANAVRGYRGSPPPVEFRGDPRVAFTSIAYPLLVKKLVRLWTGATDVRTGTTPAAITHKFEPIQSGELPAIHMDVIRDEQHDKVAGCTCNTLQLDFPLAEWATIETELRGKYRKRVSDTPIAPDFSDYPRRGLLLRDAKVYLDGSVTPVPELRGIRFNFDNNFADPTWYPGQNRVITTYDGVKRTVWWPARHKFMGHAITGQIIFGTPTPDEDFKRELAHAEELVFECEFEDLGTTPAAVEMFRVTGGQKVLTGGGPEALTKQDEITSTYDFGLFVDESSGSDVTLEFVDDSDVNIV